MGKREAAMMWKTVTAGFVAAIALTLAASGSFAADPPNLVGAWKADPATYAAIRVGAESDSHPEYADATFGSADQAWVIEVKDQKGRAFHGVATSPKGMSKPFVGVISFDGERFVASFDKGGLFGEIQPDGTIDYCSQDHEDDRASVACFIMSKE
jgi:hypothetical protein